MKRKLFLTFIVGGAMLQFSCENKEAVTCILPSTTVSAHSPAITGDNIYLTTPDYFGEGEVTFEWTGPNNFYSNQQNPVITNVTAAMKGEYKLKVSKGVCATKEATTNVDVIVNTATCTRADNTAIFSNIGSYTFNSNDEYAIPNYQYQISGGTYGMYVYIVFEGDDRPQQGNYTIVNKDTELSSGTVHAKSIRNNGYGQFEYFALSGDVLLTYNANGDAVIKFCDVPFAYSTNTSADTTASAKFIVTD